MKLKVTTVAFRGIAPVRPQTLEVNNDELTIGRAPDNRFVLEDPERYCSRYHARCYPLQGTYVIEDSSSSGTLINDTQRLERGHRYQLQHRDTLIIGEYQLRVELIEEPATGAASASKPAPLGAFSIDDFFQDAGSAETQPLSSAEPVTSPYIPTMGASDYFQPPAAVETAPAFDFSDLAGVNAPASSPAAAEPISDDSCVALGIPAHVEVATIPPVESATVAPAPKLTSAAAPVPTESPADASDSLAIRAFLKGLALNPDDLIGRDKVEIMHAAGQMLNTLTSGLIDILQARAEVKKEFNLDVTRIQATRNNPLKFCPSAEEALLKLLTGDPAYLTATESVQEGVVDAKAHQIAIMAGMQSALEALLQRFDPTALEQQLDRRFLLSKKARYWELYTESFSQLVEDAEENFQSLFGEAFARTYQEQVRIVAAQQETR